MPKLLWAGHVMRMIDGNPNETDVTETKGKQESWQIKNEVDGRME